MHTSVGRRRRTERADIDNHVDVTVDCEIVQEVQHAAKTKVRRGDGVRGFTVLGSLDAGPGR